VENNVVSTPDTGDFQPMSQKPHNSCTAMASLKPAMKPIKSRRLWYLPVYFWVCKKCLFILMLRWYWNIILKVPWH